MLHPSTLFGEELRKRRLEAGLSLTDLSGLVHYSKAQLSKVERGIKAPSRDLARLCDAALGADGALIPGHPYRCRLTCRVGAEPGRGGELDDAVVTGRPELVRARGSA